MIRKTFLSKIIFVILSVGIIAGVAGCSLNPDAGKSDSKTKQPLKAEALDYLDDLSAVYKIYSLHSQLALDVTGASMDDGATIIQYTPKVQDNQQWIFTELADGSFQIKSFLSGKVMQVRNASMDAGEFIEQGTWTGASNQRWTVIQNGDYYQFQNLKSGMYMDIDHAWVTPGTGLLQWPSSGAFNQKFRIEKVRYPDTVTNFRSDRYYKIINKLTGRGLDAYGVQNAQSYNFTDYSYLSIDNLPVRHVAYLGSDTQKWRITKNADGTFKLTGKYSGKVIQLSADGSLRLATDTGANNQKFVITKNADEHFTIQPYNVNTVLSVKDAYASNDVISSYVADMTVYTTNRNSVIQTANSYQDSQKWMIEEADNVGSFSTTFKMLFIIKQYTSISNVTLSDGSVYNLPTVYNTNLNSTQTAYAQRAAIRAANWVSNLTEGRVQCIPTVVVSTVPMTSLTWTPGDNYLPYPIDIIKDINDNIPSDGYYDTVCCIFVNDNGTLGHGGGGGFAYKSLPSAETKYATYITENFTQEMVEWSTHFDNAILHEWVHCLQACYQKLSDEDLSQYNLTRATIDIHNGDFMAACGYRITSVDPDYVYYWKDFFADFFNDKVWKAPQYTNNNSYNACGELAWRYGNFRDNLTSLMAGMAIKVESQNYSAMNGIVMETCSEGGQDAGYIDGGDWLDYSVSVVSNGNYAAIFRTSSPYNGTSLSLKEGSTVLTTITNVNSGGYQTWIDNIGRPMFYLSAGTHTLRIYANSNGFNLHNFTLALQQ